ncbi:radical SAM family heme chaperone HemW [Catenovulum sediminis]|uniref:Heme chaperone HemW n=1 Tax=Catenovulum sediminis TaxID=1740262 RepID=A0ABV1RJJ4_9ALTE
MILPPLSLYIHIPWCVQKCPYCDFNSHAVKNGIPEDQYIAAMLKDLQQDLPLVQGRKIQSIFFGGGTPSIFSAQAIDKILRGVKSLVQLDELCEITLEANPGTLDNQKFTGFKQAGVNRFSIGVQSFQADKLTQLGRIHNPLQAQQAAQLATQLKLNSFNIDLMHGLPAQSVEDALFDLQRAIDLAPPHLSWYQLTIEPNTLFASKPPTLPLDETLWKIQQQGQALLAKHGYSQYEISAYSKNNHQSKHNLNYWRFGDYLAIGCGAHGKITRAERNEIFRYEKIKHPKGYMQAAKEFNYKTHLVAKEERIFEFFMNRFRLFEACEQLDFENLTGLHVNTINTMIQQAADKELIDVTKSHWQVTQHGHRYLNDLLEIFV